MTDDEIVAVVDEHNRVVGSTTRLDMRNRRLIHRATYIFVFNRAGELFVQKRTPTKDMYPGYFDLAAGGVVLRGESYQKSAQREVAEELGVTGVTLQPGFDFYYEDPLNRIWGRSFSCEYEGEFVLQPEEVESGAFMGVDTVLHGDLTPVTPDTRVALDKLLASRT